LKIRLHRATNLIQQFLERSVEGIEVQIDMRDRLKLGEKMNQLFELNGPQTYAQMLEK
jgi:hypothetical protein